MKKIIYGASGSGKSTEYFEPMIKEWNGKVIAFSFKDENIENCKKIYLSNLTEKNLKSEIEKNEKILFIGNKDNNVFIENVVKYIIDNYLNLGLGLKTLFAIDEFTNWNLTKKVDDMSLFNTLITRIPIEMLIITQSLKEIKKMYNDEYPNIISNVQIIGTKKISEYSGELRIRFPKSLHADLDMRASIEGISLNQYIMYELTKAVENRKIESTIKHDPYWDTHDVKDFIQLKNKI